MRNQRKLCYSAYTYYFTIPKNTRSIWLGRTFRLTVEKDPLTFTFEEWEDGDITCFKIATYEALRVPKKIITELNIEKDAIFELEYTVGRYNKATFTKIEVIEREEKPSFEKFQRAPRKKLSLTEPIFIIVPELNTENNLHITRMFPDGNKSTRETRSLCRTPLANSFTVVSMQHWQKNWNTDFHYCKTCYKIYEEKTNGV